MAPTRLAKTMGAAALWTIVVWGNRVLLIGEAAGAWAVGRIVVSLVLGISVGAAGWIVFQRQAVTRLATWSMAMFAIGMTIIWVPSLISVSFGNDSPAFKAVHTVLAGGSLAFAFVLSREVRTSPASQ